MKIVRIAALMVVLLLFVACDFQTTGKKSIDVDSIEKDDSDASVDDNTAHDDDSAEIDDTVIPSDKDSVEMPDDDTVVRHDEDYDEDEDATLPDEDTPLHTEEVAIATWNVYRFFDTVCDSGQCGSGDYEELPSDAEFNAQADDIANGIKKINADVILLEEVESERCMEALASRLGYSASQWIIVENRFRKGDVYTAIMTKGTIVAHKQYEKTDSGYFSRPLLQATIDYGSEFIVFVAHFKSQSNDNPELRLAEAEKTHDIVTAVAMDNQDTLVVMGGDLNDVPSSPPLDALLDAGDFLRVADELGHPGDATYWYKRAIAIDHILMSTRAGGTFLPGSGEIFKNGATQYSFQESDHAAVRAEFSF